MRKINGRRKRKRRIRKVNGNKHKNKVPKEYYDLRILNFNTKDSNPLWIGNQKFNHTFPIYKFLVEKSFHTINQTKLSTREKWQEIKLDAESEEELVRKLLSGKHNKREWIHEYAGLNNYKGTPNSFQALSNHRDLVQVYEQFNWYVWAVSYFYFQNTFQKEKFGLPSQKEDAWIEGFIWKGVYFRLIPLQQAYLFEREMEAIKHISLELEEGFSLEKSYSQKFDIDIEESYHRKIIPPLLSITEGGSYAIYGTPVIPIQKMGKSHPTISIQNLQKEENIDLSESMLQLMPSLSKLTPDNLVPLNLEEFEDNDKVYMIINCHQILESYLPDSFSKGIIRIPEDSNEEISIHQYPDKGAIELKELLSLFDGDYDENNDQTLTDKGNYIGLYLFRD